MTARTSPEIEAAIVGAFDGGERNAERLARRFSMWSGTIRNILKRNGRKPRADTDDSRRCERRRTAAKIGWRTIGGISGDLIDPDFDGAA